MKTIGMVCLILVIALLAACINHSDKNSERDTVGNRYGADTAEIEKMKKDTAAVTDKTGDASSLDNSGSGGTNGAKDTTQMKAEPKKK